MNQGKLEVVKQEMARVNIDILVISELKWTGMGEFNSDDHCIYCCGHKSVKRNGVPIIVNKSPKCSTWVQSQKRQNDLCFQGKPFNIMVIQVYAPTGNAEEAEFERFYEDIPEKAMAPHSSTFAWKIPRTEEPGRLQSMRSLESDTTERLHFHFSL